jgi:hypothetical protein
MIFDNILWVVVDKFNYNEVSSILQKYLLWDKFFEEERYSYVHFGIGIDDYTAQINKEIFPFIEECYLT